MSQDVGTDPITPPETMEAMQRQLDLITEACSHLEGLMSRQLPITQREVLKLRKAFWLAVGESHRLRRKGTNENDSCNCLADLEQNREGTTPDGEYSQPPSCVAKGSRRNDLKAIKCDSILTKLEEYVAGRPEAHTYDAFHNAADEVTKGWRFLGIPMERRIQTLLISIFNFFTYAPLSIALFYLLLMNSWTMPLALIYIVYIFTIGRPKHPVKRKSAVLRLGLWRHYGDYFPVRLVVPRRVQQQFDSSKNYLFIYHPHGINSFGAMACFVFDTLNLSSILPGITVHLQTLKLNFFIPFFREFAMVGGCGDASAECIRATLRAGPGESVALVVGGARESLLTRPKKNELTLQERRGFVRIALQEGVPLVPVYGFGENDVYRVPHFAESGLWRWLEGTVRRYTRFAIPLVNGRGWFNYSFGFLPHRCPINVVMGEPICLPLIPNPTAEEISLWHGKYVDALQKLFKEHHGVFGVESSGLVIR